MAPQDGRRVATEEPLRESEERFRLLVEGIQDYAIFMLDPQGRVVSWNAGAERIKGYQAAEILGQHFSRFYPPERIASAWPEYELEVARKEGRFEDEGWRLRKDGSTFWANVIITALRDQTGELCGFAKITRDLTQRRRQEESLRQSEERFRLMVEAVADYAIFMLDPQGRVTSWNQGAQRIKGYTAAEILGQHFSRFYPPEKVATGWPEHELAAARAVGRFEDEGWRLRKDGSAFWANVVITALYDRENRLYGFVKITRDLTDRRRVDALEESGRQINEFLAMLAHELRNPLAPIRNAVTLMREGGLNDAMMEWSRSVIDRQVTHLTRLVDDLLDVSRITSGKITLRQEPVELHSVVDNAVDACRPLIEARRQTLEIVLPAEPLRVEGDVTRLSQVVLNLLNNAVKYTPEGGNIRLAVEVEGGQAVVRVADTGIGIPADLLPKIFDLFTQGDRSLDRSEGGLGIGLTLVRRLVELHGGAVGAHSEGSGRGSELVIRLPLLDAAQEPAGGPPMEPLHPAVAHRVLVVDDNLDAAESMAALLAVWGHEVRSAHDGPSALAVAAEWRPDTVLLDIGLPRMSGYEVAERLRQLPGLGQVALIAVTGYGQEEDRRLSRDRGFDHHLVKPVEPEKLKRLIAAVPVTSSPTAGHSLVR
jgi:PAS domain S-box-containing protein